MHAIRSRLAHFSTRIAFHVSVRHICSSRVPSVESQVEANMALKVGDDAPDFNVPAVVGVEKVRVTLAEYRGKKNVVIAFYPLDWTPV